MSTQDSAWPAGSKCERLATVASLELSKIISRAVKAMEGCRTEAEILAALDREFPLPDDLEYVEWEPGVGGVE